MLYSVRRHRCCIQMIGIVRDSPRQGGTVSPLLCSGHAVSGRVLNYCLAIGMLRIHGSHRVERKDRIFLYKILHGKPCDV